MKSNRPPVRHFDDGKLGPTTGEGMTSTLIDGVTPPPRVFRAIVFIDVVGPLQIAKTCGDEFGWQVLARFKRVVRPLLDAKASGVKDIGDRYMATYERVPDAIDSAVEIQRAVTAAFAGEERTLRLRVGIHAAEILEAYGEVYGVEVYLAGRVCAYAEGGEIMVTEAVRSAAEDAGCSYNDHGDVLLQSFEEPSRLWELSWLPVLESV